MNRVEHCSAFFPFYDSNPVKCVTGSPADNADTLEVADEILQVNGSTLENASQSEVIQYIYQVLNFYLRNITYI